MLLLGALLVAGLGLFASPFYAIPIVLLLPGPIIALDYLRRRNSRRTAARFREDARTRKVSFDERDEATLT